MCSSPVMPCLARTPCEHTHSSHAYPTPSSEAPGVGHRVLLCQAEADLNRRERALLWICGAVPRCIPEHPRQSECVISSTLRMANVTCTRGLQCCNS